MRTQFSKLALAAVFGLASAFTFSCSALGDITGNSSSSSGGGSSSSGSNVTPANSLDGVWLREDGMQITVSGNTGVISDLGSLPLLSDAASKGYVKIGDPKWRNLSSTDNLTWSGQDLLFTTSNSNVTGTSWGNITITMSTDGNTLQSYNSSSSTPNHTYTRM